MWKNIRFRPSNPSRTYQSRYRCRYPSLAHSERVSCSNRNVQLNVLDDEKTENVENIEKNPSSKFEKGWSDGGCLFSVFNMNSVCSIERRPSSEAGVSLSSVGGALRCGAGCGLVARVGGAARLELNYCVPLRARRGDCTAPGLQFGLGAHFLWPTDHVYVYVYVRVCVCSCEKTKITSALTHLPTKRKLGCIDKTFVISSSWKKNLSG